ncbi:MAG: potassium channel family protein [Ferrovibrio sp.]|uniref:potassium channel family protein n=1 Tax=Ferrovibrio sp. TaxID=1917215 RepID=UPI00261C0F78|nr:potassium channel family protein [Ferrovibrio sp.]MCW0234775.1 potassium channel family protein [Ferrovibrio sp.]
MTELFSDQENAERPVPSGRGFRRRLQDLYFGEDREARRFRYGLVIFDILTIALFILVSTVDDHWWVLPLDFALGALLSLELALRLYAEPDRRRQVFSLAMLADLAVIASLFLPVLLENLAFLRIFRALRLLRSYHLLRDLRSSSLWFRLHEDVIWRSLNLVVFIFIVTSFVYVTQHGVNRGISTYVDALYFTITTLTTTGFGDITLVGPGGRLLSVLIMIVGVSLFLRLLQAIFRPNKVRYECPDCALRLHDADAVHCKHCGRVLPIPSDGAD